MKHFDTLTGEERTIERFALFPIKANGETRWLELVTIHQSYNTENSAWNNDWFEQYERK